MKRLLVLAAALTGAIARAHAQGFDGSPLPRSEPESEKIYGVVRIHDTELTQHLVHLWEDGFLKVHPLVRYSEYTVPAWFSGLCAGTADLAVTGHDAWRSDLKAVEGIYGYPLARLVYIYFAPDQPSGEPADPQVDPKVREFLRYILSRQGQQDGAREGDYLPLTPALASAQLGKLESPSQQ